MGSENTATLFQHFNLRVFQSSLAALMPQILNRKQRNLTI